MKQKEELTVKLEAICYTWKDAMKLQVLLGAIVHNSKHVEECQISYIAPSSDAKMEAMIGS